MKRNLHGLRVDGHSAGAKCSVRITCGEGKGHVLKVLDMLARVSPDIDPVSEGWQHFAAIAETEHASFLCFSPDPARWGQWTGIGRSRILDPRGLVHA